MGLFGLNTSESEAKLVGIPVPWEITTSYGSGASLGPQSVLKASPQLDLHDYDFGNTYEMGIHLRSPVEAISTWHSQAQPLAKAVVKSWDEHGENLVQPLQQLELVNQFSANLNSNVHSQAQEILAKDQIAFVLGGDHSTPFGLIRALLEQYKGEFGILHFDAHHDLRKSYQGFTHSHASIFYNVMNLQPRLLKLVSVGVRDYCEEEKTFADSLGERFTCFYDRQIKSAAFSGLSWHDQCQEILRQLPDKVYISFDIDGLSPEFCPGTGTPVPGGLSYDQAIELLVSLKKSGRQVIGFDLCEVAPSPDSEWDGNVGARILYKLCGCLEVQK